MPGPFPITFGVQSNPSRDDHAGSNRLINAYAEFAGEEARSPWQIYVIEGLTSLAYESTAGACRGLIEMNGNGYAVNGTQVLKVEQTGSVTNIGGMPGGDGPVFMARNLASPPQIAMVSDGVVRVISSDQVSVLNDPDLPPPNSVTHLGGYFIFSISDGRFFITAANDITVDALDFATAEANPDGLVRAFAFDDVLVLFGNRSTEFWSLTGAADFPFVRLSNGVADRGCLSAASVASIFGTLLWIDHDGAVLAARGVTPDIVSNHAVERSIAADTNRPEIRGMAYTIRGHPFYVISGETFTWVYDLRTQLWHERKSYQIDRWRAQCYAKLGEKHVVGDYNDGRFYTIDQSTHTENANAILWEIKAPIIHAGQLRTTHKRLDLHIIPGVGLNSAVSNESDPQIELRYSDDGGNKWSTWRQASMGKIGEHDQRVRFHKLGHAGEHGRIYHVRSSAPVVRALLGGELWT